MYDKIQKITIEGRRPGPHLLITAGVHGDEYEPMEAVRRLIKTLTGSPGILKKGRVSLVPVVNEPAFQEGSRCGADGLDLARVCPGDASGSITLQIAARISGWIKEADFYIDMHGGGTVYDISPFAGYVLHEEESILRTQRTMARAFNFPMVLGSDPSLEGRTLSVARDASVPAIYTEYGGGGVYREEITQACVQGCLNVLKVLGFAKGTPVQEKVQFHIEDHRPQSGYLQAMLPSPKAGFFLPKVYLGQEVQAGETVGYINDTTGKAPLAIEADQSGFFFLMRAVPSVKKGDSLGGIVQAEKSNTITVIYE